MSTPQTPDEFEQRQNPDGSIEEDELIDDARPLSPDEVEQRQVVGGDEDEERVVEDEPDYDDV